MIDMKWTRARIETCRLSEERDAPEMTQSFSSEEVSELADEVEQLTDKVEEHQKTTEALRAALQEILRNVQPWRQADNMAGRIAEIAEGVL